MCDIAPGIDSEVPASQASVTTSLIPQEASCPGSTERLFVRQEGLSGTRGGEGEWKLALRMSGLLAASVVSIFSLPNVHLKKAPKSAEMHHVKEINL